MSKVPITISKIEFENDAKYITAWDQFGDVHIRCYFDHTDCRDDEPLPDFIKRHGGLDACAQYLKVCYWYNSN